MLGNFKDLPSVDHLTEGVHYRIVNFDFASTPLVSHTPGTPCPEGYKMVFGMCRKLQSGTDKWDRKSDTDEEKTVKEAGSKAGSTVAKNVPITVGKKKYGWAMLGEKPIVVEWGSVAGIKNPDGTVTKPPTQAPTQTA